MGMDEITQSYAENVKKRFYTVINNSYTVICCSTVDKKKSRKPIVVIFWLSVLRMSDAVFGSLIATLIQQNHGSRVPVLLFPSPGCIYRPQDNLAGLLAGS